MIGFFHLFGMGVSTIIGRVKSAKRLLRLFLVENIQVRSMRGLYGDNQTLIISSPSTAIARIIPNRQILQIFVSYISVFTMRRIREELLLLCFELADKVIQVLFNLTQLLLIGQHCKISVSQFRVRRTLLFGRCTRFIGRGFLLSGFCSLFCFSSCSLLSFLELFQCILVRLNDNLLFSLGRDLSLFSSPLLEQLLQAVLQ